MTRPTAAFVHPNKPYAASTQTNEAGHPSFERPLRERYLQLLLTNTVSNTFYTQAQELIDHTLALHQEMILADPVFATKAIVYARQTGFMRLQPIVGLAALAKFGTESSRSKFDVAFNKVILTPGDLQDFVEIVRGGKVGRPGMGRMVKTQIGRWLNRMSEYHAIKYASGGQGYALRDLLRLARPKPANAKQNDLFNWITDREKWGKRPVNEESVNPQVLAFEALKSATTTEEKLRWIEQGRLPHEVVTGTIKPDLQVWTYLMHQMPTFALLRNLNSLQRAGVFKDRVNAMFAQDRLNDALSIRKAKILPFRVYQALRMFAPAGFEDQGIRDALVRALDAAVISESLLGKRVVISPDVSGSMANPISGKSDVEYRDVAAIFAASLFKQSDQALVLAFDDRLYKMAWNRADSVYGNASKLREIRGGGTDLDLPLDYLLSENMACEVLIAITDSEEWAGSGFLPTWRKYKATQAGKDCKAFLIQLSADKGIGVVPPEEKDVYYIYGWGDQVLSYIDVVLSGGGSQIATVEGLNLYDPYLQRAHEIDPPARGNDAD
jgi:60 kDa SS-A/Ro ribonucleoprotein